MKLFQSLFILKVHQNLFFFSGRDSPSSTGEFTVLPSWIYFSGVGTGMKGRNDIKVECPKVCH